MTDDLFNRIGNAKIYHWDIDYDTTINGYLGALLLTLLAEGEGFNGKRPLGNSGWEDAMPRSLAFAGIIKYEVMESDEEDKGQWEIEYDENRADKLIEEYINELVKRAGKGQPFYNKG